MNFQNALDALKDGENLVRASWTETDGYLTYLPGVKHVWKIITTPSVNAGNHVFSVEELSAHDWQIKTPVVEGVACECCELDAA